MTTEAGWRPDPYARAQQRYWDGSAFTDRIRNGDEAESHDPLGATATIPFTNPTGISPSPRVVEVEPQGFFGGLLKKVKSTVKRLLRRQ